jgi:hypothetical protein
MSVFSPPSPESPELLRLEEEKRKNKEAGEGVDRKDAEGVMGEH